jgi:Asp-tRNA(Asn)/Glu-tRNA(Gln) amidotransferase C subunit
MNFLRTHFRPSARLARLVSTQPLHLTYTTRPQRSFTHEGTRRNEKLGSAEPVESAESSSPTSTTSEPELDIEAYLSSPSWSVKSLLQTGGQLEEQSPVSPEQLRHLLRLSALPQPKDAEEEAKMLETLTSQLFFVREIQKVDTSGVAPLRALRDERLQNEKASEITLESLKEALDQEEVIGEHYKRLRRKQAQVSPASNPEGWNPLDHAQLKVGKFFVVDSGTASMKKMNKVSR